MIRIDRFMFGIFCFLGLHMPINAEWMYPKDLVCEHCQKYLGQGIHPKILRSKIEKGSPMQLLQSDGPVAWYESEWRDEHLPIRKPGHSTDIGHNISGMNPTMFFGGSSGG